MRYLFAYAMCLMIVVKVRAHLPGPSRMLPQPLVPVGSPLIDPFRTGPGMLRGGWNNVFLPQGHWGNFGQWPQTWDNRNTWNNGISAIENRMDGFNNNAVGSTDPWEQYRRFNSGMRGLADGIDTSRGISTNVMSSRNQLTQGPGSNNYPWNTFATQNNPLNTFPTQNNLLNTFPTQNNPLNTFPTQNNLLNTFPTQNNPLNTFPTQNNIPAVTNGINQGFVSPQLPPNFNNQFQNQPFLSQGFPNRLPATNGVFV
ncbi:uncharacterized protein DDB_G0287625-like [Mercenaria mercenaria]|uniref:uncharacterized protein DDB_G0287625-like n=1 Tax=Mercenaria mercenaria TaxID=6596 RepID=UPI00234E5FCC|nr:uncharacterized protein DDB_G0287625-like [Mercenaria mercenaria]